jgi:hypothetical protein
MAEAAARPGRAFPDLALADTAGRLHPLREAWRDGEALFLIGHRGCSTTREAIPVFERIHRRRARGSAVLVLQDEADAARALVAELALGVPIRLEPDPYPLAAALELVAVPTLLLVARDGRIASVSEGFRRTDLEALAERLGVAGPLFLPEDRAPAFRPG